MPTLAGHSTLAGHLRRLPRFALATTALMSAVAFNGCASPNDASIAPVLGHAISRAYPDHLEIQPKLAVGTDPGNFPYTPGTLIFAAGVPAHAFLPTTAWTAETDVRCGHTIPISRLKSTRLRSYSLGSAVSARTTVGDANRNSLSGVTSVRIALTNVRRIAPAAGQLRHLIDQSASDCPLAVFGGLKPIQSVLIGDVKVDVRFERSISLSARLAVLRDIQASFGLGYHRISDRAIVGRQVAFAIQWKS